MDDASNPVFGVTGRSSIGCTGEGFFDIYCRSTPISDDHPQPGSSNSFGTTSGEHDLGGHRP